MWTKRISARLKALLPRPIAAHFSSSYSIPAKLGPFSFARAKPAPEMQNDLLDLLDPLDPSSPRHFHADSLHLIPFIFPQLAILLPQST